ncbi:MAG: radical SAM protein [Thermodesulfobacteriota bacterium]
MEKPYRHALCLHPYYRDSESGSLGIAIFPPTGLEYVAAALKPHVDKLTLVDLRLPGPMRDLRYLQNFIANEIDLLCISINWEYHFDDVCKLVNSLPSEVLTVVGGKQATDYLEDVFDACPGVDMVVRGEGEPAIAEIADRVPWTDIPGISFRKGSELVHNDERPFQRVDGFHYPDRTLRQRKYHFTVGGVFFRGEEFDIVLTSRGCPHKCKFCTFSLSPWGRKRPYSSRDIESVIAEIRETTAGIILFADEDFFVNPGRAKAICDRIVAEGIRKRFLVQSRIEIYKHPEVLESAERAGVKMLLLGIESPTDRILDQLNKGFTTAELRTAFQSLRRYSFYLHGYFIYGNVTETDEEMMRIPVFARELGLDSISYQKLRIERHSPLRELVEATPGYYIGDDGILYREGVGRPGLKRISARITRRFYVPTQLLQIARKVLSTRLFSRNMILLSIFALPMMLIQNAGRGLRKHMQRSPFWSRLIRM